eukprot:gene12928-biopygen9475
METKARTKEPVDMRNSALKLSEHVQNLCVPFVVTTCRPQWPWNMPDALPQSTMVEVQNSVVNQQMSALAAITSSKKP